MWTSYLSTATGFHEVWYLNFWIIVYQFGLFLLLAAKYGILGVKLRLEKTSFENTINSIIDGTSVISKAIDHESFEINSCIEAIRNKEKITSSLEEKLSTIEIATNNLKEITAKISYKLDKVNVVLEPGILSIVIESAISVVQPYAQNKNIKIMNRSNIDATVLIDTVQVIEVIKNILLNSIEAIENDGIIQIETEIRGDNIILFITDNGVGIVEENIDKVITPFFSTKVNHRNLGLGLSYCYRIMKAHEGNIRIRSKQNKGTVLQLIFPKNRVINTSERVFLET
jgi:signal transduction histidine kinase